MPVVDTTNTTVGIVLAAGAGRRMGTPKALMVGDNGEPWLVRAVRLLREAGCEHVIVVLGAAADEARALLTHAQSVDQLTSPTIVVNSNWQTGMASSLASALEAAQSLRHKHSAALITLVDLPNLPVTALNRVLHTDAAEGIRSSVLRRATFRAAPGHPVLIGRDHWSALATELSGDQGARSYLDRLGAEAVECGDLGDGSDRDAPDQDAPHRESTSSSEA